jgi:hypothetical protein
MGKGLLPHTMGAKPTLSIVNLIINYIIAEKQWYRVINRTTSEHSRAIRAAMPGGNRCSSSLISQQPQSVFPDITYNGQLLEFILYKEKSMEK